MIQFDSFMQAEGVPIYQQIIRYVKQGIACLLNTSPRPRD